MDTAASPPRHRAALASLDANAMHQVQFDKTKPIASKPLVEAKSPEPSTRQSSQQQPQENATILTAGKKRVSLGGDDSPAAKKKTCRPAEPSTTAHSQIADDGEDGLGLSSRSYTPEGDSVFDHLDGSEDASWATTATDVSEMGIMPVLERSRTIALTREQARERAEILRLRLGLASYKLRTGQISVPLANLQAKPLLPRYSALPIQITSPDTEASKSTARQAQTSHRTFIAVESSQESCHTDSVMEESEEDSRRDKDVDPALSVLAPDTLAATQKGGVSMATPQQRRLVDDTLMSPAERGGAVTGLLSLARGPR